jgi:hypothetical protein
MFQENRDLKDELEELKRETVKPQPVSDMQPDVKSLENLLRLSNIENEQRLKVLTTSGKADAKSNCLQCKIHAWTNLLECNHWFCIGCIKA